MKSLHAVVALAVALTVFSGDAAAKGEKNHIHNKIISKIGRLVGRSPRLQGGIVRFVTRLSTTKPVTVKRAIEATDRLQNRYPILARLVGLDPHMMQREGHNKAAHNSQVIRLTQKRTGVQVRRSNDKNQQAVTLLRLLDFNTWYHADYAVGTSRMIELKK